MGDPLGDKRRGIGVEGDGQQADPGTSAGETADDHPFMGDVAAGYANLVVPSTLVADGQRLGGRRTVEQADDQAAAGEIGGIAVLDVHIAVDDLGVAGIVIDVGAVIDQNPLGAEVVENRVGRGPHQRCP